MGGRNQSTGWKCNPIRSFGVCVYVSYHLIENIFIVGSGGSHFLLLTQISFNTVEQIGIPIFYYARSMIDSISPLFLYIILMMMIYNKKNVKKRE